MLGAAGGAGGDLGALGGAVTRGAVLGELAGELGVQTQNRAKMSVRREKPATGSTSGWGGKENTKGRGKKEKRYTERGNKLKKHTGKGRRKRQREKGKKRQFLLRTARDSTVMNTFNPPLHSLRKVG